MLYMNPLHTVVLYYKCPRSFKIIYWENTAMCSTFNLNNSRLNYFCIQIFLYFLNCSGQNKHANTPLTINNYCASLLLLHFTSYVLVHIVLHICYCEINVITLRCEAEAKFPETDDKDLLWARVWANVSLPPSCSAGRCDTCSGEESGRGCTPGMPLSTAWDPERETEKERYRYIYIYI